MNSKAGKIALAVVVLVVAALFAWRTLKNDSPVPRKNQFVDVVTGEMFTLDMRKVAMIPARHPKTGDFTLLPCHVDDKGVTRVSEACRSSLQEELKTLNKTVDAYTLEVKTSHGK